MRPSTGTLAVAALLACGTAFAQPTLSPASRMSRNCTTAVLATDPTAPCPDDVLKDTPAYVPRVGVAPGAPVPAGAGMIGSGLLSGTSTNALGPARPGGAMGLNAPGASGSTSARR